MTKAYILDSESRKLIQQEKGTRSDAEVGRRVKTLSFVSRFKLRGVIIRVPVLIESEVEGYIPIRLYDIYNYETDQLHMGVLSTEVIYDE